MKVLYLAIWLWLLAVGVSESSPFLFCEYYDQSQAPDSFKFLVNEGPDWTLCAVDQGANQTVRAKCDLHGLPEGGHLLRMKALKRGLESPGNVFLYVYKFLWQDWMVYYVLKSSAGKLSWELQAVEVVK